MGSRSQDFWGISWTTVFTPSSATSWNSAKAMPENSTGLVGIGLTGSKLNQQHEDRRLRSAAICHGRFTEATTENEPEVHSFSK